MATYVNNLRLKEITTGDEDGTWGTSTNTNLELITDGFSYGTKQMSADANETFTMPDATADATRGFYLKITSASSLTGTRVVTLGPNTISKVWMVENATTGSQIITIKQGSGGSVNIASGSKVMLVTDGAGAGAAVLNANPTEVGGSVTSVSGTGTVNGVTLTGTVTSSGSLTLGGALSGVNLTSQVTGVLPIANGGTNLSSLGSAGQVLQVNGAGNALEYASDAGGDVTLNGVQTLTNKTLTSVVLGGTTSTASGNMIVSPATQIVEVKGDGSSVEGQIKLNCHANTHGQTVKAQPHSATVTNTMLLPKGANSTLVSEVGAATLTNKVISGATNTLTVDGTNAVGFRNIPQNSQSAAYTLVLADAGKHILHPAGDASTRTFTIPANASVAYVIGTAVTFINMTSQVVTIAITSDTMYLSDAGTTGSRSLAQYGSATAIKITATNWVISGSGLT